MRIKYRVLNKKPAPYSIRLWRRGKKVYFVPIETKIKIVFEGPRIEFNNLNFGVYEIN